MMFECGNCDRELTEEDTVYCGRCVDKLRHGMMNIIIYTGQMPGVMAMFWAIESPHRCAGTVWGTHAYQLPPDMLTPEVPDAVEIYNRRKRVAVLRGHVKWSSGPTAESTEARPRAMPPYWPTVPPIDSDLVLLARDAGVGISRTPGHVFRVTIPTAPETGMVFRDRSCAEAFLEGILAARNIEWPDPGQGGEKDDTKQR